MLVKLPPFDEFHRIEKRRRAEMRVVQRRNVRVPQPRDEMHLILERRGPKSRFGVQQLQRFGSFLGVVYGPVDFAKPTYADLLNHRVAAYPRQPVGGQFAIRGSARLALFEVTLNARPALIRKRVPSKRFDRLPMRTSL